MNIKGDNNRNKIRNFSAKTETTLTSNQQNILPDIDVDNNIKYMRQNSSEAKLLNELSYRTQRYEKKYKQYQHLKGEYGDLLDDFNRNFVSVENINSKKREVLEQLKVEKENEYNVKTDLQMTKFYLINKNKELADMKERFKLEIIKEDKYKIIAEKAIQDSNEILKNQQIKIQFFQNLEEEQKKDIEELREVFLVEQENLSKYKGLVEILQGQKSVIQEELNKEREKTKDIAELLERDKVNLFDNLKVLAGVNDNVKAELNKTKKEYSDEKTYLQGLVNVLEEKNTKLRDRIEEMNNHREDFYNLLEVEHKKKKAKKIKYKKGQMIKFVPVTKDNRDDTWERILDLRRRIDKMTLFKKKCEREKRMLVNENQKIEKENEEIKEKINKEKEIIEQNKNVEESVEKKEDEKNENDNKSKINSDNNDNEEKKEEINIEKKNEEIKEENKIEEKKEEEKKEEKKEEQKEEIKIEEKNEEIKEENKEEEKKEENKEENNEEKKDENKEEEKKEEIKEGIEDKKE